MTNSSVPMSRRFALPLLLGVLSGTACSFTLDFRQCRDSSDCENDGGLVLACESGACVDPTDPSTISCASDEDCTDRFGAAHLCSGTGHCASFTTELCPESRVPEGVAAEDLVFIGSITDVAPPDDIYGVSMQNAVRLAVEDFDSVARFSGDRRLAWVACDAAGDPDRAAAAAEHLAELGVAGIVGPTTEEETVAVAEVARDRDILVLSPTASTAAITDLADDGLVWRMISSDSHQAPALVDRISTLSPNPERVVLLAKRDAYGDGMRDGVTMPLQTRLPPGGLITLLYNGPGTFDSDDELRMDYGAVIAVTFEEDPDTIVVIGGSEARELILFYLEVWAQQNPLPPLPRFIVTHSGVPVLEAVVESVAESFRPDLMPALEGMTPVVRNDENFDAYAIRYGIRFDGDEPLLLSGLAYDAALVLALAAAAQPEGAVSGASMATALPKLADKSGVSVSFGGAGLAFIGEAMGLASAGAPVDLVGVSGEIDFDPATGDVRTDLIGWDVEPRMNNPAAPVITPRRRYTLDAPPANSGTWADL
jgi:hypothetical protein